MIKGEKIRFYRNKIGLTQEELCYGICSPAYLSKLENNKIKPKEDVLQLLCDRLNISLDDLTNLHSSKYFKALLNWYDSIKRRDRERSKQNFSFIKELMTEKNDDIELQWLYKLFLLRYYIFTSNKIISSKLFEEVLKNKNNYSSDVMHFYYNFIGLYYYSNGYFEKALLSFEKSTICSDANNYFEPELIYNLALVQSKLGRQSISILNTYKALHMFHEEMKVNRVIDCYILLGINFNRVQEYELAEKLTKKALENAHYHDDPLIVCTIYHNLGLVESNKGNSEQAIQYFYKSISYEDKQSINTLYLLAKEYFLLGNNEKAQEIITEGLSISETQSEYSIKLKLLEYDVKGLNCSTDYLNCLKRAYEFFTSKKDLYNVCFIAELIATYYQDHSHYKKATKFYSIAYSVRKTGKIVVGTKYIDKNNAH